MLEGEEEEGEGGEGEKGGEKAGEKRGSGGRRGRAWLAVRHRSLNVLRRNLIEFDRFLEMVEGGEEGGGGEGMVGGEKEKGGGGAHGGLIGYLGKEMELVQKMIVMVDEEGREKKGEGGEEGEGEE